MSDMPPSGQRPSLASRLVRGVLFALLIAGTTLFVRHLLDRRDAPAGTTESPRVADESTARDLLVDLPPSDGAARLRALDAPEPGPAATTAPAAMEIPAPATASLAAAARMPVPSRFDSAPLELRSSIDPGGSPASAGADARPQRASTDGITLPPPSFIVTSGSAEAVIAADLEQQRHLDARQAIVRSIDGAPMVRIEAARFTMGDDGGFDDEAPEHEVDVDAFWIDRFEVTIEQALGFNENAEASGHAPLLVDGDQPDHPFADVSWAEAEIYCEWAGGKLPTEAQWELAARTLDGRDWPWGSRFDVSCVNAFLESAALRAPMSVDSLECGAAPGDIRHLAGNVAEWTLSEFAPYEGDPPLEEIPTINALMAVRGGSFKTRDKQDLTTHAREGVRPGSRRPDLGFRCALSPEP